MIRITNNLFESIRQVTHPVITEAKAEDAGRVDGAHYCATHVEHNLYGEGECISEQHATPNADGTIDWYNVKFADGNVRKIQTEAVKVKKAKMHEHTTLEGDAIDEKKLHPNQQVLDVHEPEKDELTAKDFEMLRKGKKPDVKKEEVEIVYEANIQPTAAKSRSHIGNLSHPTTNHVAHPSSGKEIGLITKQPDGKYHAHPSSVKLSHSQGGTFDTKDQAHQHIRDAHAKAIKTGTLSDRWKKQEKLPQFAKEEAIEGFDPLKHIEKKNQNPAIKAAAKDVGRGDYGARAALMKAGKVKDDRGPRGVTQEEAEKIDELSIGTLTKVQHVAKNAARDAFRDGDDVKAEKRYNLAGKASHKAEMKYRAAGLKPSGQHTMEEVEEAVSETIVKHNDFTIEITDNPTFGDFLRAVQSIVRTDEESMQQEIVAIAEQAFAENYEEVIIEAFTRMELEDKIAAHRKAGNTVSDDKYSTKNGQPYAEYVVTDQEGGRKKYIHHGTRRGVESMSSVAVKK